MTVFDIETDGLDSTKIHVLSWSTDGKEIHNTHDYDVMRKFFTEAEVLVGHNIVRFDIPAVEKVLGIKVTARLVDTLGLAWYLDHERARHGLKFYGEDYGIQKPEIEDWKGLTPEDYAHRCDEDVRINCRLWKDLDYKLSRLYPSPVEKERFCEYLTFKLECAAEQESLQWKLDVAKAEKYLEEWSDLFNSKSEALADAMPPVIKYKTVEKPSHDRMYLKNGDVSVAGQKWIDLCREYKVPETTVSMRVIHSKERANPNSPPQIKSWLDSLGWVPKTFKFTRNKVTGDEKSVPQTRKDGELCSSVRELADKEQAIIYYDGLSVLQHRISVLKGMVNSECDGYVQASVQGFTNTLRFRHAKPLVNLPAVDKPYGKEIRDCLIAPEGYVLCGADMTSLEDTTKRHYMKPLDPDYVEEMSKEGFDPHLDLAKHAGMITQDDIDKHNSGERKLTALRKNYKAVNYSATYGVGAPKLSRETGMSRKEAKTLLDSFWSRNWSVEKVASETKTKEVLDSLWLWNPVSKFWYSLRSDKDKFSTLNQGTGVFCFDTWVALCRKSGIKTIGQFHDEIIALVQKGEEQKVADKMKKAADSLNEKLQLNVPLGTDVQFGNSYAEIH